MSGDGEFELIARIRERLREAGLGEGPGVALGTGDDAAVTVPRGAIATSVDALVEGVHFRRETSPLRSIGRKALAAGLSDLAAMGAGPGESYVVLGVPPDLDEDGCLEVYEGLASGAKEWGAVLLGGDVTRAPVLVLAVTVIGHADSAGELVARAGAEPGQAVAITGELGGAAAGLQLLERPELALAAGLTRERADALRRRHLEPAPRLEPGRALAGAGARAMIDVSDGLGADARHVAIESGARLEIDVERVPVQDGVRELAEAAGLDPLDLALAGGEDYELLACVPRALLGEAREAVDATNCSLTVIGEVAEGAGVELRDASGVARTPAGFDHLRHPRGRGESGRSR